MKTRLFCLSLAVWAGAAAAQEQPWSFVQAVGGLKLGNPVKRASGWALPVAADVSGLNQFTTQPSRVTRGLVCRETKASLEGQSIFITLVTADQGAGGVSKCPPVLIGSRIAGTYAVFYRYGSQPPVALGSVALRD